MELFLFLLHLPFFFWLQETWWGYEPPPSAPYLRCHQPCAHSVYINHSLNHFMKGKVKKFMSLFHKINTYLQKSSTCKGLQEEHIFFINI